MTLGEKQRLFTRYIGMLITFAYKQGFELTFGDAYRSPEQAALNAKSGKGIAKSLHCERLAVDFNLFINGVYQQDTSAYHPLGEFWEGLDPLCRWGGRFKKKDGNHFSLTHEGRS
jgi:hypothetical protein